MNIKFFKCEHCGNIITFVENKGVPVMCCGQKMTELVPSSTDAATEKHVPVVDRKGNEVLVKVGSVQHPMFEEHYIQWIAVATENGVQIKYLKPGTSPEAVFVLAEGEKIVDVFEYCNLHGLWKA